MSWWTCPMPFIRDVHQGCVHNRVPSIRTLVTQAIRRLLDSIISMCHQSPGDNSESRHQSPNIASPESEPHLWIDGRDSRRCTRVRTALWITSASRSWTVPARRPRAPQQRYARPWWSCRCRLCG
jgi:hypothetical protein